MVPQVLSGVIPELRAIVTRKERREELRAREGKGGKGRKGREERGEGRKR